MPSSTLLREARLRAGLTQAALANKAGVAQSAIARWESGRAHPALRTLTKLVRACGLELRLGIAEQDATDASLIAQQLRLSPAQRLDQLTRTVQFVEAGRAARLRG